MIRLLVPLGVAVSIAARCFAQAPAATAQPKAPAAAPAPVAGAVRPIPPPGIEVPAADRAEIEADLKELAVKIEKLRKTGSEPELPNVEIFYKSADWALRYNEVFDPKQIATAKDQVKQGLERAEALEKGQVPWNSATGLVVRGYRSAIDDSVQPYGLVIPADFKPGDGKKRPLHFWCHGRGEKLSELAFIAERQKTPGEFVPEGAIVCHLYGRYCNANKFAGERDLFEALEDIKKHYAIDEQRLVIRGFSMGGAACWQFATHFPGMWVAAAPGAGFAETAEFFKVFAPGKEAPPAWEQKLWRWYDCTTMAGNLANTTTVAYSGEIDGQKQAADIMLKYAEKEGQTFSHIIGPQTAHKYHAESKPKINEIVDVAVAKGNDPFPHYLRFTTYSLIYPGAKWLNIQRLEKHWERADVSALFGTSSLKLVTRNVAELGVATEGRYSPSASEKVKVSVDGQEIETSSRGSIHLKKNGGKWTDASRVDAATAGLAKRPGLCGPIDHAFMSRFVFVRPTGKPFNDSVGAWTKAEMERAIVSWRSVFRGDVKVVDDTKLSNEDIKNANLILWGDPSSNAAIAKVLPRLPLKWDEKSVSLGGHSVDAAHHAPIMIYPSQLNTGRYIVLNSGFTFREAAALNNSDQTPKLPDWALVDLRMPPGPKWPGKIVEAGFFDEEWK
jgi:pimeloyl-ACP methyl ester carboxylesterase